jgi:uncharacterized protein YjbI with pentapeptide repeats
MHPNLNHLGHVLQISAALFFSIVFAASAQADIFQWEYINPADPSQGKQQSTTLAADGAGVDAVPSANLYRRDLTMGYLIGADLMNASAEFTNLTNADLSQANLTNATFIYATLTRAGFTDADVRGAWIYDVTSKGFTADQLYSTASYQTHDLAAINLGYNNLSGWNFAGQNLANAQFARAVLTGANFRLANLTNANFAFCIFACDYATLTGADLTAADARGSGLNLSLVSGATTANLIWSDGHIDGLDLDAGGVLVVRDHDFWPITIDQHLAMGPGGTLRMVFEADAWDSTISFAPGIPVTLGGTLELTFAADVNLASQIGRTFDLFDWTGVTPTGAFAISSPYAWDLSNLYTTGEATLIAIPEPRTLAFVAVTGVGLIFRSRRLSRRA